MQNLFSYWKWQFEKKKIDTSTKLGEVVDRPYRAIRKSITPWQNTSENIQACNDGLHEQNHQQSHSRAKVNPKPWE